MDFGTCMDPIAVGFSTNRDGSSTIQVVIEFCCVVEHDSLRFFEQFLYKTKREITFEKVKKFYSITHSTFPLHRNMTSLIISSSSFLCVQTRRLPKRACR